MGGLTASVPLLGSTSALYRPPIEVSDTMAFGVSYRLIATIAKAVSLSQGVGMAGSLTPTYGQVLLERLKISLAQIPNHKFQLTALEEIGSDDSLVVGLPTTIASGIGVNLAQQATLAIQIIEELDLLPTLAPLFTYNHTLAEEIAIADALARFLGAGVAETIGMQSVQVGNSVKPAALDQGIGVAATQSPQLIIRVTAAEEFGLNDINALQLLYSPEISEGIELSAAYLSPGGGVTTWAMNTRTGAVTEYSNYAFNSFARHGDKYIGASEDGLYELLGDDDAGADIISQIKSGFAQWAGTHFTLFKAAYLGVRGEGDFVLRLMTGEGLTYDYAVSTRDMRSTKVHMGKGIRTRYFRFELISSGQDFDLESIEFVPLVAQRRV